MKYLESKLSIAGGELLIRGTRIRVSQVINMLANGYSIDSIHEEWFPQLTVKTLRGSVEEAAQYLKPQVHA